MISSSSHALGELFCPFNIKSRSKSMRWIFYGCVIATSLALFGSAFAGSSNVRDHRNGSSPQGGVTVTQGTPPSHGGIGAGTSRNANPRDHRH
jgi:hypothetical protein